MRMIVINDANCQKAVKRSKRFLAKSRLSNKIKAIGKKIEPVIIIKSDRRSKYLGFAFAVSERYRGGYRRRNGITTQKYKTIRIGKQRYFLVIEINPTTFTKWGKTFRKYLNLVIGHEMGHLLDIIIRQQVKNGWVVTDNLIDHDLFWQKLSLAMGGDTCAEGFISPVK